MGRKRRRNWTEFEESAFLNQALYERYFDQLFELAVTLPKWTVPDTVDTRYMERSLILNGAAVFFKDEVLGYMCLPVAPGGNFDNYGNPLVRTAYGYSSYNYPLTIENSVIIYDNAMRKPLRQTLEVMAYLMCDYDMTIKLNSNAQKTPLLLECEENERLSAINLFKEYLGNAVVIKGRKGMKESMTAIQPAAPFVGDKLYEMKIRYWNEALTILGVPNMIETHHQRQSTDEVYRDMGGMLACQYNRLYMRQQACEKINRMFPDANVKVEYSVNVSDLMSGAQGVGKEMPDLRPGEEEEDDE